MTLAILALVEQVAALWKSTAPPERPEITYHDLGDSAAPQDGETGDRGFWFGPPVPGEVVSEQGDVSHVDWTAEAIVRFSAAGRDPNAFRNAMAKESARLRRRIEALTSYPAGVIEVLTEPVTFAFEDNGDGAATITLRALCADRLED